VESDYRFGNFLQRPAFRLKDKASLTDSFLSPPKQQLGGVTILPVWKWLWGNASPHGHLPLAFSRSAICIQTGQRAPVVNHPDRIIGLQVRALSGADQVW
jgi:hypothetical protein